MDSHVDSNGSTTDIDLDTGTIFYATPNGIYDSHKHANLTDDTRGPQPDAIPATPPHGRERGTDSGHDADRLYTLWLDDNGNTWCNGRIVKHADPET